jgi:oligoendopeptidase F
MEGPQWMSEAFAIFNELLLLDRMYRTGADARARMFYLEALIDDITFQIFTSAAEGSLEQAIYEGVNSGSIKSAADLDAIALAELGRYDAWSSQEPARKHLWMAKRLMFEDPLYLVNYLRAGLLATKMYAMAKTDAADFSRRYLPLLKGGFHAEPDVLLREFFGRDVPEAEIIEDAMRVVGSRIEELAKLYASVDRDKKKER